MGFERTMEGEDEEKQREEREGKGKEGKEEGEKGREEEEEKVREERDDEWMADAPGNVNDIIVTSRSPDHLHPTTTNEQLAPPPTTSPKLMPTRLYDPSTLPKQFQLPTTPLYWCNPMTVTSEQIEENMRWLLHEWLKDDGILFPREVLEMLRNLKMKVRSRDEEKARKTRPLTTVNVGTPGEPKPNQTGQIPAR